MNQQLRLLPAPKPLTRRLGAAFFRGIPRSPGVYRMDEYCQLDTLAMVWLVEKLHELAD